MEQIKKLAEDALVLQNKLEMERALREIVVICKPSGTHVYEHKSLGVAFCEAIRDPLPEANVSITYSAKQLAAMQHSIDCAESLVTDHSTSFAETTLDAQVEFNRQLRESLDEKPEPQQEVIKKPKKGKK